MKNSAPTVGNQSSRSTRFTATPVDTSIRVQAQRRTKMRDENRECPRCDGRDLRQLKNTEEYMERDGYDTWSKIIVRYYCEDCDLVFSEGSW